MKRYNLCAAFNNCFIPRSDARFVCCGYQVNNYFIPHNAAKFVCVVVNKCFIPRCIITYIL